MKPSKLLAIFTFCVFITCQAHANLNFAVINVQKVSEESTAFKEARAKIDLKVQDLQKSADKTTDIFQKKGAELDQQKNVLSVDEYNKKQENFKKEAEKEEKYFYNQRVILEKATQHVNETLLNKTHAIVEKIAKEKAFVIVLSKEITAYNDESIDITNEVVLELNKQLKSIDVNLS